MLILKISLNNYTGGYVPGHQEFIETITNRLTIADLFDELQVKGKHIKGKTCSFVVGYNECWKLRVVYYYDYFAKMFLPDTGYFFYGQDVFDKMKSHSLWGKNHDTKKIIFCN